MKSEGQILHSFFPNPKANLFIYYYRLFSLYDEMELLVLSIPSLLFESRQHGFGVARRMSQPQGAGNFRRTAPLGVRPNNVHPVVFNKGSPRWKLLWVQVVILNKLQNFRAKIVKVLPVIPRTKCTNCEQREPEVLCVTRGCDQAFCWTCAEALSNMHSSRLTRSWLCNDCRNL